MEPFGQLLATVGQPFGVFVEASDPDGEAVAFELTQKPSGMQIDAEGLIT